MLHMHGVESALAGDSDRPYNISWNSVALGMDVVSEGSSELGTGQYDESVLSTPSL